jgi:EAL domain-containing protein (putative c-di-GMP-specific phosphodiesterase class I)/CHASE2 domain-containing sensor protein
MGSEFQAATLMQITTAHTAPLEALIRRESRPVSVLMLCALALVVTIMTLTGAFRAAENSVADVSFSLLSRPASGQIHIVEMDAASMAEVRRWPWPRDHYARVLKTLDAAGARSISFDVDFSGVGDAAGDRAFAEALAAASVPVALPTFSQKAGSGDVRQLDSLPIPMLREQALLTSVGVRPDRDGFVRRLPLGTETDDTPRPSLAAFAAGRAGAVETDFPIDFAIDPATIPRHSFMAIERGQIPLDSLAGKDVIIGATAIELGDRYAVPRQGVVPGVIIQALAAETLVDGVPVYGSWTLPLLVAAGFALTVLMARHRRITMLVTGGGLLTLLGGALTARMVADLWFEIVPAIAMLAAACAIRMLVLTQRRAVEKRQIDAESGLPNRRALDARLVRSSDSLFVAAQIDEFDAIKLAVGAEDLGDLLRRIADRLQVSTGVEAIYRIDPSTLAWVSNLSVVELEAQLAGIRAIMRSPFEVAGRRLGVSLTFGVAGHEAADPAAQAAHAASLARRAGKFWRLHTAEEGETVSQQLVLLGELDEALRSGAITVLYQPKLNLQTRRIDAVEALVRWNHPERGLLPPDCFIQLFEERNRIDDLTIAVLTKALEDMRGWCDRGLTIGVAVNISAGLLASESFTARTLALVGRSGAPAHRLTFEVTESTQFEDVDKAILALERFRASGIRISMDDYGTGQSALNYLKLLPLSELKIDRMFVAQAHVDKGDAMLVRSTVQLAHQLGLKVVAEGVEEPACLAFLEQIGCDYAQGYVVGRPLSADCLAERAAAPEDTDSVQSRAA